MHSYKMKSTILNIDISHNEHIDFSLEPKRVNQQSNGSSVFISKICRVRMQLMDLCAIHGFTQLCLCCILWPKYPLWVKRQGDIGRVEGNGKAKHPYPFISYSSTFFSYFIYFLI